MSPLRLISLVVAVAGIAMPAAATSAVTIEAFGGFCLERALFGRPVAPAAVERGMEIISQISDAYAPDQYVTREAGHPLAVVTATGFGAHQIQAPMPEGIVVLQLATSKVLAKDPAGRNVDLVYCVVTSAQEHRAARALVEVRREVSDKLPRAAVASEPYSNVRDGFAFDTVSWTWGDIDSDSSRFEVSYSGTAKPCFMGGGILFAYRIARAPE